MATVRLEPTGQVVEFCADGFEPTQDLSGTPVFTRDLTPAERAILKSYSPYHRYHFGLRAFSAMFTMLWVSFAAIAVITILRLFDVTEKGSELENISRLGALGVGFAMGVIWQWYYGRSLKHDFCREVEDLLEGQCLVQQISCHRAIKMDDINWDSRMGGLPWLVETVDNRYIYLQGTYLDKALQEGQFPAPSFEVARAPKSGWGLALYKQEEGSVDIIEREIYLHERYLDGSLVQLSRKDSLQVQSTMRTL